MSENSDGSLDEPKKNKFQYSDYFMRSFLRSKMRTINQINSNPIDKRPPWRTNSFAPNQLYRFNYLETEKDALEKRYKGCPSNQRNQPEKVNVPNFDLQFLITIFQHDLLFFNLRLHFPATFFEIRLGVTVLEISLGSSKQWLILVRYLLYLLFFLYSRANHLIKTLSLDR
jgi:hypothetical protein